MWASEGAGSISNRHGALVLESTEPGLIATTYFVPEALPQALFEFEVRGRGADSMKVDWLTGGVPRRRGLVASPGTEVAITGEWTRHQIVIEPEHRLKGLRIMPDGRDYKIEIRAARVLSSDGTEMMRYDVE